MKDVSVILVSYKTRDITLNCINSILDKTRDLDYEIILVDNDSRDGTVEAVMNSFPQVVIIESGSNLGFAGGCNLGSRYASGKYLLFLNTDTILIENSIKVMFDFMEGNPEYGVIGVVLVDKDDNFVQSWGDFFPVKVGITEYILKPFLPRSLKNKFSFKGKKYKDFVRDFFGSQRVVRVDYIIGADMFIRRDIFEKVGGFDDRFFMYFEEADLQIRVLRSGYKIGLLGETRIIHLESGSFKVSNHKRIMKMVSFLKYLKKNFVPYYVVFKPFSIAYAVAKMIYDIFLKEYTFRENLEFLKSLVFESY